MILQFVTQLLDSNLPQLNRHPELKKTTATRAGRTQGSHRTSMDYRSLEDRCLLAANIFYDASTDIVTVIGDHEGDRIDVSQTAPTEITVAITGGASQTFDAAEVSLIRYYANGGDDSFYNTTSINSLFGAGAGNDYFSGGSGNDTVYAGDGNDTVYGNDGDDNLNGGNDDDFLSGDAGNDIVHGDRGNDIVNGGLGNDSLYGEYGDDVLSGGEGDDLILAFSGNDELYGGAGDDAVYGQGDDDLVFGNEGHDRVRGNNGNDQLWGGDGNDFIMSDAGNDIAYGEAGNDRVFAFEGVDFLDGGDGDDEVIGERGTNTLRGGNGNDLIIGGDGVDYIFGDADTDLLYGRDGNDEIDGGSGVDRLLGGNGDDALYGNGLSANDTLVGGAGNDRFLVQPSDTVEDQAMEDAVLEFIDRTSAWTHEEIVVMSDAFRQMYEAVGNNLLIQETLNNDNLKFYKYAYLNGNAGLNYLETSTSWYYQNGVPIYTYEYNREIRIVDWDETDAFDNDQFVEVMIHEIAHNWDSELELNSVSSSLGSQWTTFLGLSGWTDVNPNSSNYTRSHDQQWWYLNSSQFAENYGRTNPNEDMATIFEHYFENGAGSGSTNLDAKLNVVDSIFTELASM